MHVEFTGRQVKVAKTAQQSAQQGIERVEQLLGKVTAAACIFGVERHLQVVEITLKSRQHNIVAHGESTTQSSALRLALEHAESQAQRFRDRMRTRKRQPKVEKMPVETIGKSSGRNGLKQSELLNGTGKPAHRALRDGRRKSSMEVPIAVQSGGVAVPEPHVLSAAGVVASRSMTMEQAVKKAESEDRDLLIFRNPEGRQFVLHRRRDGQMEMAAIG